MALRTRLWTVSKVISRTENNMKIFSTIGRHMRVLMWVLPRGPLLFIIYINDITASSNIFKFLMYADDTTIFTTINCFENNKNPNQYIIYDEQSKINEWLIVNKLSLNASKTKFMVFSMPQKKVVIPRLKFADTEIGSVDQFNFLGITLDNHLNWNAHIIKLF